MGGHVPAYRRCSRARSTASCRPRATTPGGRARGLRPARLVQRQRVEPRDDRRLRVQAGGRRRPEAGTGPGHVPRLPGARELRRRRPYDRRRRRSLARSRPRAADRAAQVTRPAARARSRSCSPRPFFVLFVLFLFWPVLSALRTSLFDESLVGGSLVGGARQLHRAAQRPGLLGIDVAHARSSRCSASPPLVLLPLGLALLVQPRAAAAVAVPARVLRAVRAAGLGRGARVELDVPARLRPDQLVPARASASPRSSGSASRAWRWSRR